MNKAKNIFSKFIGLVMVLVISLTTMITSVLAAAPASGTVARGDKVLTEYVLKGYGPTFRMKYMDGNKYVYCLDHNLTYPSGQKYTLNKAVEAGLTYIISNGYPTKSITGDKEKDYYITQLAIWWYLDDTASGSNLKAYFKEHATSTDIGKKIYNLKEAAKKNNTYGSASIKLSLSDSNMSLSSDGNYYVSKEISVNSSNVSGNYTVTLKNAPEGTIVTDTSGKEKTSFSTSEKFIVKVPYSSASFGSNNSLTVLINAKGSINKAYKYTTSNGTIQPVLLAYLYGEESDLSDSLKLNYVKTTSVSISKSDATTGEEVEGAKLVVKDSKGNVIDEWISTSEPHIITKDMPDGVYTLTETIAPEGYKLSSETIEFTVKNGKATSKVEMKNERIKGSIAIDKKDLNSKESLTGAVLVVKDSKGNVIEEFTTDGKAKTIDNLEVGTYTVEEKTAPKGYILTNEIVTFEINKDGSATSNGEKVTKVTVYNTKKESTISISKQDITNKEELPGATLIIKDENGKEVYKWVSESTPKTINGLADGKYTLTEVIAPEGYVLSAEVIEFEIKDGKLTAPVVMYNAREVKVPITASSVSPIVYVIGIATMLFGTVIIGKRVKYNQ